MEKEEWILDKMENQKQEVINRMAKHVGTGLAEDFCKILASAHQFGCTTAEKLVYAFNLSQKDLFSVDDDYESYEKEFIEDLENTYIMAMGD